MKIPSKTELTLLELIGESHITGRDLQDLHKTKKREVINLSTLYTLLRRLRREGWVNIKPHPDNDRNKVYSVTKGGLKALTLMQQMREALGR